MNAPPKIYGDRWIVEETLSQGGQGKVFLVRDQNPEPDFNTLYVKFKELQSFFTAGIKPYPVGQLKEYFADFITSFRSFIEKGDDSLGALKLLHPPGDGVTKTDDVAVRRMEREIAVLESVDHPSLVKIRDSCVKERWFTMEYMGGGTLADRADAFAGRPLAALKALRPVVEAVARLHEQGFVHRDIKPANIFVAQDDRLVLGDCGLAFDVGDGTRNTATFENVGSRDFQPPWSYGKREEEVGPAFDAFSLGKVLWTMVSGKPVMQLWYFDRNGNDLRAMFPREHGMRYIHRILEACIVEHEADMKLQDASGLLHLMEVSILALESGSQLPNSLSPMRCRFCGIGKCEFKDAYAVFGNVPTAYEKFMLVCNECGHVDLFAWPKSSEGTGERMPPSWSE